MSGAISTLVADRARQIVARVAKRLLDAADIVLARRRILALTAA